jgi:conjugal transfer mating pair stabilization protein TraN
VPGFGGTDFPQGQLFDNPDALASEGAAAAKGSSAYKVAIDPRRPAYDPATIDMTRGKAIEASPDSYMGAGEGIGGAKGKCQPLPGGTSRSVTYFESCNVGAKVTTSSASCDAVLTATSQTHAVYDYTCDNWPDNGCAPFDQPVANGVCRVAAATSKRICLQGDPAHCAEPETVTTETLECSEPVAGLPAPTPRAVTDVVTSRDETACAGLTAGGSCTLETETCIDSDPQTRVIDGASITQACWKWRRSYTCGNIEQANDCAALQAKPGCTFDHEECLDDLQVGDCQVKDEVYRCTADAGPQSGNASLCGSDLYCLNGECSTIEREASTEFRDALVAVHAMGDVRDQFDPSDLSLFKGEATGCHRPIFGLVNCCAGKSSGLLSASAGAAAIAGGPAAIAALATPFLTQFLCSSEEKLLDVKDRMGLCHYVGTYCSQKVLFVCTTKRKSYCCFPSKLSRILQEQGRAQLGKGWGDAKHPDCAGFSVAEFQRLDLARMDFSEIYADFTEAAKLPDEVAASAAIQDRIQQYYQLHGGTTPPGN